ncbi:glycosyl hydrolase-related protein [Streptomyces sp. WMMC500]|uniref:alpha-mannosidase n=1 Tax=Streptomyces sp. WMMC500 TaxID=3015154 RepID=UPI00248C5025|nr:glycoside hydrolase family 38 C-terminal domain-containing protein [Streptomyces sp. WMMC500]WBB57663.1 glycosyl hydrolase-related protein [Streptomyces sp. WMMC500]
MHDDRSLIESRIGQALEHRVRPAVHPRSVPLAVEVWNAPGEPVPVAEGLAAAYTPTRTGEPWGRPWGTSWFRVRGTVPEDWAGQAVEAVLDIGFTGAGPGFQAEALVYRPDATAIKSLNPRTRWVRIADEAKGGEEILLYLEGSSNPEFSWVPTGLGDWDTADPAPLYRLRTMDLAVVDRTVWELVQDFDVLTGLMRELSTDDPRRWEILRVLERALDLLDHRRDVGAAAPAARETLAGALAKPAHASAHRISAVGHAHIDSAWLWPLRESVRKVARTASNVTDLMDDHPEFVFAMSQAQQLAWIKEHRPEVYARVKEKVAAGQFVPVGGMWVESDTNMPGGEALARQFVHGKRFFLEEFGVETDEVWLPDSFGYSAALPQLVRQSRSTYFLTQKISWSQFNKFPHHTFWWEGLDGTRVFTHFPPVDTYNSDLGGRDLAHAVRNFQDKGSATRSLVPFGWGDGGGGPTREMLAAARRLADLEGAPRVTIEKPSEFFAKAEADYPNAPVWLGELYLELHRGTYTSHAKIKQGNRRSEHLLREAELWCATAAVRGGAPYPYEQLDRIWKTVLLHQFHDILPGSSIAWVNREARATYRQVFAELEEIIDRAQGVLAGDATADTTVVFNATPHGRAGVPALGARPAEPPGSVSAEEADDGSYVLDNGLLRVVIDGNGLITSARDAATGREAIAPGGYGNLLQVHPDLPGNGGDAWDVDQYYRNTVTDLTAADAVTLLPDGPHRAQVRVVRSFGTSRAEQTLTLAPGARRLDIDTRVDWHETQTILKAAFALDVHADTSLSETQFGHVRRPAHTNTSWDAAKFEICAHRWIHVAEPGYGVAVANDSTYGHDVTRSRRDADGGITTTVRLSLLRATTFPDPHPDEGTHRLRYALVPGASVADAIREGYALNLPPRALPGDAEVEPLVAVDGEGVVVESVKLADDGSGDVVVRLYESLGGRAEAVLVPGFAAAEAAETDLLERRWPEAPRPAAVSAAGDGRIGLSLRPFQIVTLRLGRR